MTLRAKTLLIIGLSAVCLILFPYLQVQKILRDSVAKIEAETAKNSIQNAISIVEDELKAMERTADGWSTWYEPYEFVDGKRSDLPAANVLPSTFKNLRLNVFMFNKADGGLIHAQGFDLNKGKGMPVPASLISAPKENAKLRASMLSPKGASGFLLVDGLPMLVVARPVMQDDYVSSVKASLLIGRYLSAAHLKQLSLKLGGPIRVYAVDNPRAPAKLVESANNASLFETRVLYSVNTGSLLAYTLMPDLTNEHALVLEVESPRAAYEQSRANIYRFVLAMLPTALLFGVMILLLLEYFILSRLSKLRARVVKIRVSGDLEENVTIPGEDEISSLSQEINRMLLALRESHSDLQESEERYRTLIERQGEGIGSVDENETFTYCNPVAEEMFGAEPGTLVGKNLRAFVTESAWKQITDETAKRRAGEKTTYQMEITRPDGQRRCLAITATPWFKDDGSYDGAMAIFRDETLKIRAESELRQVESMRRQFFDGASHELKTPLTATLGMVETLLRGTAGEDAQEKYLQRIREQTLRMANLIEDLMTLSRLEAAEDVLHIEILNLCEPVTEAIGETEDDAKAKGIKVSSQMPDERFAVVADRDALFIMVRNLLDNALKYTPAGGSVTVSCRKESGFILLDVADTGIGIDPSEHERIFERFYRVDKARSRELGGTGLGLSIVQELARLQDGSVSVRSEVGKGSVFTLRLPAAPGG